MAGEKGKVAVALSPETVFIREWAPDVPSPVVIRAARAAGLKRVNATMVSNVRSYARKTGVTLGTRTRFDVANVAKTNGAGVTPLSATALSATDFIRQHPDVPAKELIKLGVKAGFKLDASRISKVRSAVAHGHTPAKPRRAPAKPRPAPVGAARANGASTAPAVPVELGIGHEALKLIAGEIGYSRAIEILQEQQTKLRSILTSVQPKRKKGDL